MGEASSVKICLLAIFMFVIDNSSHAIFSQF